MKYLRNKWYSFDKNKGSYQALPPIGKWVLVRKKSNYPEYPDPVGLGYRRNAAGDKQCPTFTCLGLIGGEDLMWNDCLPDDLVNPGKWPWPNER